MRHDRSAVRVTIRSTVVWVIAFSTVLFSAGLMAQETVNCHPLDNAMTTSIAAADLIKFLEATGHRPRHRSPR